MASHLRSHASQMAELSVLHSIYARGGSGEGTRDGPYHTESKWSHFNGFHDHGTSLSINGSFKFKGLLSGGSRGRSTKFL